MQAIRKEMVRAREEWESGLSCETLGTPNTPEEGQHSAPDTYCFEMLSMVLALSGSAVGRAHLAQQDHLLRHLLSLLHTGSARVQRQVGHRQRWALLTEKLATLTSNTVSEKLPLLTVKC